MSCAKTAAQIALAAPPRPLPAHLETKVMRALRSDRVVTPIEFRTGKPQRWVPWAIAAGLLAASVLLVLDEMHLRRELSKAIARDVNSKAQIAAAISEQYRVKTDASQNEKRLAAAQAQIDKLKGEREELAQKATQAEQGLEENKRLAAEAEQHRQDLESKALADIQVATLSSKFEDGPRVNAIVMWNSEKQEGVLKATNVPPNASDEDYQLWIVDPKYKQPVSAGVFSVQRLGATKIPFHPREPIASANAFAVSVERKGGVEKAEGPIVLSGKL